MNSIRDTMAFRILVTILAILVVICCIPYIILTSVIETLRYG